MKKLALGVFAVSALCLVFFLCVHFCKETRALPDGIILIASAVFCLASGLWWLAERGQGPFPWWRIALRILAVLIALVWLFAFALWLNMSLESENDYSGIIPALEESGVY